jgi:hypothetical protein
MIEGIKDLINKVFYPREIVLLLNVLIKIAPQEAVDYIEEVLEEEEMNWTILGGIVRCNIGGLDTNLKKRLIKAIGEWEPEEIHSRTTHIGLTLARLLKKLASKEVVKDLKELLKTDNKLTFMVVSNAIARSKIELNDQEKDKIIKRLGKIIRKTKRYRPEGAFNTLVRLGGKQAIQVLKDIFKKEKNTEEGYPYKLMEATKGLARLNAKEMIEDFKELLVHDSHGARAAAAEALAILGAKGAIKDIKKLLRDELYYVRRTAMTSLAKLGDLEGIKGLIKNVNEGPYHRWFPKIGILLERLKGLKTQELKVLYPTILHPEVKSNLIDIFIKRGEKGWVKKQMLEDLARTMQDPKQRWMFFQCLKHLKRLGIKGLIDDQMLTQIVENVQRSGFKIGTVSVFNLWQGKKELGIKLLKDLQRRIDALSYHRLQDIIERLESARD